MPADQLASMRDGGTWWQAYVEFADWAAAEQTFAGHLAPLLRRARDDALITGWWFMRKHPCWRLRVQPAPGQASLPTLSAALDALAAEGKIAGWRPGIYEAEETAFGGPGAMAVAHGLFTADSSAVMDLVTRTGAVQGLGRRELSVLLCGTLLRAAGLEWYEQGDTWHRVARERPLPADVPAERLAGMAGGLRTLMHADTTAGSALFQAGGPAAAAAGWGDAFRGAGQALGTLARTGTLQRGLREVLAYHVIFHWNRLGLPARQQAILATAAHTAILGPPPAVRSRPRRHPVPVQDPAGTVAMLRWLPLVPRPRPGCPDLETRVRRVGELAASCAGPPAPEDRIDLACTAWNQAALIAADCGLTGMAAGLCERQFAVFRAAGPVSGLTAIACLQPLVNRARLDIRAGQPERAWQALVQIHRAVRDGGTAGVRGIPVSLDAITGGSTDPVAGWLRGVLLQDGTRALAAAGAWARAAGHAAWYDDAPGRMREARQARIAERISAGDGACALTLIDSAQPEQPWEDAVAACLRALACLQASCPVPDGTVSALAAARSACPQDPATILFRVRLGLTATGLASLLDPALAGQADDVIAEARQSGDALAAREVLRHPAARAHLTAADESDLSALVRRAGLGQGAIPPPLAASLAASVDAAETVLTAALAAMTSHVAPGTPGRE